MDIECPVCGSPVRVWVDMNTKWFCDVNAAGRFSTPSIQNYSRGDCDAGVICTDCEWGYNDEDLPEEFEDLAKQARQLQNQIIKLKSV